MGAVGTRASGQRGQASVEWVALIFLVAVALSVAAATFAAPWLAHRIGCALLIQCRGEAAALEAAYGDEIAGWVRALAPGIVYERGTSTLPVDFRRCRSHACSDADEAPGGDVWLTEAGERATVFAHAVDRRDSWGDLYVQYWLYYPDSTYHGGARAVASGLDGVGLGWTPLASGARAVAGHHAHDWESYQVRVGPDGAVWARASAHHGYAGRRGWPNLNELPGGAGRHGAWTPWTGWTRVSRGSHAGHIVAGPGGERRTESEGIAIVPIETLPAAARAVDFGSIAPPWEKGVYADPEDRGT